jgi:phosphoribosylglycinamide formyltransferase-1
VHFVSSTLDNGPLILQARVPLLATDDVGTLAARVLEQEHRILPQAIRWFAEGRLAIRGERVTLDGKPAL